MKKTLLVLTIVAFSAAGCRMLANLQLSAFFSAFVLDKSVKAIAY